MIAFLCLRPQKGGFLWVFPILFFFLAEQIRVLCKNSLSLRFLVYNRESWKVRIRYRLLNKRFS